MKLKDELKLLNSLDRRIIKNIIIDLWKNPYTRIAMIAITISIIFLTLSFINLGSSSGDSELNRNYFIGFGFLYIFFLGFFSFFLGMFSSILTPEDTIFLLPRPISSRSIFLKKIRNGYIFFSILLLLAILIMFNFFKSSSMISPVNYLQFFYGGLTFSFTFFALVPMSFHYFHNLQNKKLSKFIFKTVQVLLIVCFIEFGYLFYMNLKNDQIIPIFEELFKIPPLNILLIFPLSSVYICISDVYNNYFWLAVIGNGVFFVLVFILSLKFNYNYYSGDLVSGSGQTQSRDIEISTKDMWWRRGIFKDTPLDYPHLKDGEGAVMEISLLTGMRTKFSICYMLLILIIMFSYLGLFGPDMPEEFFIFMFVIFSTMMAIMMPLLGQLNIKYSILRQYPLRGMKLFFYQIITNLFFIITPFFGGFIYLIYIGMISNIILIFILLFMSTILTLVIFAGSEFGSIYLSSNDLSDNETSGMEGIAGGMLIGFIVLLLNIILYFTVSSIIDNIWKFFIISLVDIGLVIFFAYLFKFDYNRLGIKQRKRNQRVAILIIVVIVLGYITSGLPISSLYGSYSDVPTSWDVKVRDEFIIENDFVYYDDYLFIVSTGSLSIINSTIVFNCSEEYSFGIYLAKDGWLHIENSSITTLDHRFGMTFIMYGYAWINNTIIENIGLETRPAVNYLGVQIYSDYVSIYNSEIYNSKGNGITCNYGILDIENTRITNCGDDGIDIFDSEAYIINCTIEHNSGHGIFSEDSKSYIYYCTFRNNDGYGIRIDGGKYELEDNVFEANKKGDIKK